jgi:hypothetical protein
MADDDDDNILRFPHFERIDLNEIAKLAERYRDARLSTVFIGLDHRFVGEGPPIVFETMVFGGKYDQYQDRCATWDEAEAMHQRCVEMVRQLRVVK